MYKLETGARLPTDASQLNTNMDVLKMSEEIYDNELQELDNLGNFYQRVAQHLGIRKAEWCLFHIRDFSERFADGIVKIVYYGHDDVLLSETLYNPAWADAWRAADTLILGSRDCHHIFVEDFKKLSDNSFELVTGS
jgi:hypothetical protein